jgi:hypothetical protein
MMEIRKWKIENGDRKPGGEREGVLDSDGAGELCSSLKTQPEAKFDGR